MKIISKEERRDIIMKHHRILVPVDLRRADAAFKEYRDMMPEEWSVKLHNRDKQFYLLIEAPSV